MIDFSFDGKAEGAVRAADEMAARMVVEISKETEANLRNLIAQAIADGDPVYDAAENIHDLIGLTSAQGQAVMKYRDQLEGAGLRGDTLEMKVEKYSEELLTARAETIARSEIMDALNAGQNLAWEQAQEEGKLTENATKEWITTPDEMLCPECEPMDGKTVPVGESFPDGDPPLHPNCRCTIGIAQP